VEKELFHFSVIHINSFPPKAKKFKAAGRCDSSGARSGDRADAVKIPSIPLEKRGT
jgi:hypothetical protein